MNTNSNLNTPNSSNPTAPSPQADRSLPSGRFGGGFPFRFGGGFGGGFCLACLAFVVAAFTSCIDEDLSKCGVNYAVNYAVHRSVDLKAEVADVFYSAGEQGIAAHVEGELGGLFSGVAHDLDLSFFVEGRRSHWQSTVIDASSASLTYYLKQADYRHLTLSGAADEAAVAVEGRDGEDALAVSGVIEHDTVDSHSRAIYSARMDMPVEGRTGTFRSDLYMVNSAVAVVLGSAAQPESVTGCVDGMASGFAVNDSLYSFDRKAAVRMWTTRYDAYHCLYAVAMPSRDAAAGDAADGIWQVKVYVSMAGKITESVLHISEPLPAGGVKIIKGVIKDDGSVTTESPEVGVSVTLDWKPCGSHDVEM